MNAAKVLPLPSYARKPLGRWALEGYTSDVIAEHLGIRSAARARRVRAEALDPISVACALAGDCRGDGARIVTVVQEAFESRFIREAGVALKTLRGRLGHLVGIQIHESYHGVLRVLLDPDGGPLQQRLRAHTSHCIEAAAIRSALGLEDAS